MGSCSSQKLTTRDKWNPISDFLSLYSFQELIKQWDDSELEKLNKKYEKSGNQQITFDKFTKLFSKLDSYSQETKKRFYKLFDYQSTGRITRKELIIGITIIRQIDDAIFVSQLIYYVYLTHEHLSSERQNKKKFLLDSKGYTKFVSENKNKLAKHDQRSYKNGNKDIKIDVSKDITLQQFQDVFQNYRYDLFMRLFETDSSQSHQIDFIAQIQKANSYKMKQGTLVYLLEYQWFYNWKNYLENKYDIVISYIQDIYRNKKSISIIFKKSQSKIMEKKNMKSLSVQFPRPQRIKNSVLLGEQSGQLRSNLKQFCDYVILPKQFWQKLVEIYGGSPAISRKYPQIHTMQLNIVYVDQYGKFFYTDINRHNCTYKSTKISHIFEKEKHLKFKRCFFKTPGQQDWEEVFNLQIPIGELTTNSIIYMCLVLSEAVDNFIDFYNYRQKNGQRYIQKRIKNYASVINIPIEGALLKGVVTDIIQNSIQVTYKNESGHFVKTKFKQNKLKSLNPSIIQTEKNLNFLAGMTNYNNNCYLNSIIQCLIRTPSLDKYLSSMNFLEQKKKQGSVTSTLQKILEQSKKKGIIETQKFKKAIQKQSRIFQGSDQQDAQQFLIALLQQLSQEAKSVQNQQISAGFRKNLSNFDGGQYQKQKKIARFFAGINFGVTQCAKCHNKNQVTSPFFTYTLNLPEHQQFEIDYFIIPLQKKIGWEILNCAITITATTNIQQFMNKIATIHDKRLSNLNFYCFSGGQLFQKLDNQPINRYIKYYHNFGFKIAVYEIDIKVYPMYIQLRSRYQLNKIKNFKLISCPILIPVSSTMHWIDIQNYINETFAGKYSLDSEDSEQQVELNLSNNQKSNSSKKISKPIQKNKEYKNGKSLFNAKFYQKQNKQNEKPYRIRTLLKDNYKCYFCKKKIAYDNHMNLGTGFCKGCELDNTNKIFSYRMFSSLMSAIIIMLDWNGPNILKEIPFSNHKSLQQSNENAKKRIDFLENIFKENFDKQQLLQLKCSKQQCISQEAFRREGIKQFPNILLIHFNRFRYKDGQLVKMNNSVNYPQVLVLNEITYQLFGTVVHTGSCTSGHYYSFVSYEKLWFCCNDEKVRRAQKLEYISPFAYILFYRRKDFQPGIASLSL